MNKMRYRVARFLMHAGLRIMPPSRYKTELIGELDKLYLKVIVTNAISPHLKDLSENAG